MAIPTRILSLCTGLGGLDIGVEIVMPDARVVCAVERDAYCAAVLAQLMEQGVIPQAPIWDDLRTFDGKCWCGSVDILTAGYPCQPFSVAGQKRGATDLRNLWPEVARIVDECRPEFVFLENVARHLTAGFDVVARDLQSMGYTVAALVCRAATVGAPHQRERLFALAMANGNSDRLQSKWKSMSSWEQCAPGDELNRCSCAFVWPPGRNELDRWKTIPAEIWPSAESAVCRMVDGLSDPLGFRREQLHALGNAVVPLQAAYAFATLAKALRIEVES